MGISAAAIGLCLPAPPALPTGLSGLCGQELVLSPGLCFREREAAAVPLIPAGNPMSQGAGGGGRARSQRQVDTRAQGDRRGVLEGPCSTSGAGLLVHLLLGPMP